MIEFKRVEELKIRAEIDLKGFTSLATDVDADTLLKQFLTAYLDGVEETSDEKLAMLAHVAGFDVVDISHDVWMTECLYWDSDFSFSSTPFRIIRPQPEPSKTERLEARLDEVQKELDSVRAEMKGGAV